MFDVQPGTENCPFCNFVIPPPPASADDPVPVDEHGTPTEPAPAVPVPDPESMVLEGTLPPSPQPTSCEEPAPPPPPAGAAGGGALKLVVIAAAAFLAFKLGLLDNLLMLVGLASPPAPPPAAIAVPGPSPQAAPEPARAAPYEPLSSGAGGPIASSETEPEAQKPAPAAEWTFEGTVYDMLSFRPVKGVVLLFMTENEDETFESRTDARGHFKIVLPPRPGGYKLVADHPEYIGEYFDETAPSIKTWSLSKRRQMRAARPSHRPWAAKDGAPVRRDFVLFPDITDR